MTKAFLSHSSKDKRIVELVVKQLNAAHVHYDSLTFQGGTRSAEAVANALADTKLFVLFASRVALESPWVKEELSQASHHIASGDLTDCLIFVVDESVEKRDLPTHFQQFVLRRTQRISVIVNVILSRILDLNLTSRSSVGLFVGRDSELATVKAAITEPGRPPKSLCVFGWEGIGRRTLAQRALHDTLPWLGKFHPEVELGDFEGLDDAYRKAFDCLSPHTPDAWTRIIPEFTLNTPDRKIEQFALLIENITSEKQVLFLKGNRAITGSTGGLQSWLGDTIDKVETKPFPQVVLICRRGVSFGLRRQYPQIVFQRIQSLGLADSAQLLNQLLRIHGMSPSETSINEIAPFLGGHPVNIKIAAEYAREYGLERLVRDKIRFREVVRQRSSELLELVELSELQKKILVLLLDFRYLGTEDLVAALGQVGPDDIGGAVHSLEDHGVVEWESRYFKIAPYLEDAVGRVAWASSLRGFRNAAATKLLERVKEIETSDFVTVASLDAAILGSIRQGLQHEAGWITELILPGHLLNIAREEYDFGKHKLALALCREALAKSYALSPNARIEGARLLAMSAARLEDDRAFGEAMAILRSSAGTVAERNSHFVRGFRERLRGRADEAEGYFRAALALDSRNFHCMRELAGVLCAQERYEEAEVYARDAYKTAPANSYVIGNLLDVIIGRASLEELDGNAEVAELFEELREQDRRTGSNFFEHRLARYYSRVGRVDDALKWADEAVDKNPRLFGVRVSRAWIRLDAGDFGFVGDEIGEIQRIVADLATGEGKSNRFLLTELRVRYHLARGEPETARGLFDRFEARLPRHVKARLARLVSVT